MLYMLHRICNLTHTVCVNRFLYDKWPHKTKTNLKTSSGGILSGVTDTIGKSVSGQHQRGLHIMGTDADCVSGVTDTAGNVVGGKF